MLLPGRSASRPAPQLCRCRKNVGECVSVSQAHPGAASARPTEPDLYLERERAARAEAEAAAERLRAIQTITDAALGYLALDDSLRDLLNRTRTVLAGDSAAILLLTEDNRHLTFRTADGLEANRTEHGKIPLESSIVGKIVAQRK